MQQFSDIRGHPVTTEAEGAFTRTRAFEVACGRLSEIPNRFRAVGTWIGYFSLLYELAETEEQRARVDADLRVAEPEFDEVMAFFDPGLQVPDIDAAALAWFRECLEDTPGGTNAFLEMAALQRDVLAKARAGRRDGLKRHFEVLDHAVTSIAPTLEALFRNLQNGIAHQAEERRAYVTEARESADDAVARINDISRMVRLISLNAAVEAARANEAGRGFSVIAAEIKSLSEQIGETTGEVGERIGRIIDAL